ncbi:DUF3859 domain-containing protein [Rhodopirellula sp. SWK7]|uniref:DUF3859 domain-containing protein n=1 Tax=Rhodopirellula sp. SWK7 TaxID=595460 RepID=UPI0002BFC834|nr:DUF3859 domain-containing protein [Rhodopirellula sp. SWK7]EMI40567.1 hypothetical protein RRSWK_06976 [Rhodopirellula sp. SWK7]
MAKRKIEVRLRTHGIYSQWESGTKQLPRLYEVTTEVPAVVDVEFGFVVNIKNAKNQELYFCIDHPGIRDDRGKRRAPFDGTVYVKTNDWDFYLGDTVWEPIDDKLGEWHMWLELDGKVIAEKTFQLSAEPA